MFVLLLILIKILLTSCFEPSSFYIYVVVKDTFQIRKYDLEDHFKSTGDIVRVSILKTNKAAYIQFKDHWSVEGALCMDGTMLRDKVIKVKRKKWKSQ